VISVEILGSPKGGWQGAPVAQFVRGAANPVTELQSTALDAAGQLDVVGLSEPPSG
jgi:hypothetical protein